MAQKPADLMENCNQWKITYPTGDEEKQLCDEPNNEYFFLTDAGDAIVFKAPIRSNNGTTPNSSYIRSELRERVVSGESDIYWTTEGSHMIYVKQAITHLPINKSHLVATQIHGNKDDGIDDSMVLRLEDSHLFLSFNGGKLRDDLTIKTDYSLGTIHEVIFVIKDGKHYCYYSEDGNLLSAYNSNNASSYLIKDNGNDYVMDLNYDETYFKIGNYTQSNAEKEGDDVDDPENYGEVYVYDFTVVHDEVAVTSVNLNAEDLNIKENTNYQLNPEVLPDNATNKNVSYSSSNNNIVSVNSEGIAAALSIGTATITVTTEEGGYTDTININVIENSDAPNLALNKTTIGTGTHDGDNEVANLTDGFTSSRWSVSGYPQSAIVDLGQVYTIGSTELVCYKDRAYQYQISVATSQDGTYTQIVDGTNNSIAGLENNPIIDVFTGIDARFVKITVSSAYEYTGTWVSLLEFRVFESSSLSITDNNTINNKITVYPNPSNGHIQFNGAESIENIKIYNNLGKLVLKQPFVNQSVDITQLKPGLYVIQLFDNQKFITKSIVKN